MNVTDRLQQEAEVLNFGFLADRSRVVLERAVSGQYLDEEDREILSEASDFFRSIANGAEIVSQGSITSANVNVNKSLDAFNLSMELLETLPVATSGDNGLVVIFKSFADTVASEEGLKDSAKVKSVIQFMSKLGAHLTLMPKKDSLAVI